MMLTRIVLCCVLIAPIALLPMTSCESLPGDRRTQATVIGGVGGAALGALIARDNRLLGALIGGALGAGGGYLIGAEPDRVREQDQESATRAAERATTNPARPEDVAGADTADLNSDGFVTLDEVVAMHQAGLRDNEMIRMLEATGHVFELTEHQEDHLLERGVSRQVVWAMRDINQAERQRILEERDDVISAPRT